MRESKILRASVLIVAGLISTSALSWDFVGRSGKFEKFIQDVEIVQVNQRVRAVKVKATRSLLLEYCEVFFRNGASRFMNVAYLEKGDSEVIRFRNNRRVKKVRCLGSTVSPFGSRGRVEVSIKKERKNRRNNNFDIFN